MIKFESDSTGLILIYSETDRSTDWVDRALKDHDEVKIAKVFYFQTSDLLSVSEDDFIGRSEHRFRLASCEPGYFRIPARVLAIGVDVLLADRGLRIDRKLFITERNVSIFRKLADVATPSAEIVVGGDREGAIPVPIYEQLIRKFPKGTELDHYARTRVAGIVGDFFDGMADHRARYEAYLDKRASITASDFPPMQMLLQTEIEKYVYMRGVIAEWLGSDRVRAESEWQAMILDFILLVFPKYVAVLRNVHIEDRYTRSDKVTPRYIDIALVDANGNIDVIEIKRPFGDLLLSKSQYRGNYVPSGELSGTIMQAEKYLFHLSKWGVDGEKKLNAKRGPELPVGITLRITNPRAIAILGRDRNPDGTPALSDAQSFDLEVIKRKYAKMMDIITYDDLLRRLDNVIASLAGRLAAPPGGLSRAAP
jgi:hypothetical protein